MTEIAKKLLIDLQNGFSFASLAQMTASSAELKFFTLLSFFCSSFVEPTQQMTDNRLRNELASDCLRLSFRSIFFLRFETSLSLKSVRTFSLNLSRYVNRYNWTIYREKSFSSHCYDLWLTLFSSIFSVQRLTQMATIADIANRMVPKCQ